MTLIFCKCGCEQQREEFDKKGRKRKYILGHHSKEEKEKRRKQLIVQNKIVRYYGENNPNWKGGITELNMRIRKSSKYSIWRFQIFGRDNLTCQKCGIKNFYLEVHHIKKFSDIIGEHSAITFDAAIACKELWDISNGITLCKECHNKTKGT